MRELSIEEIRTLKKKYGLSNAQLSDESGVSLGTVNKVLSGATAVPRNETLQALAKPLLKREQEDQQPNRVFRYSTKVPADSLLAEEAAAYGASKSKQPGEYTIEDYLALPDDHRVELIDGFFYDMAAPTTVHQRIVLKVAYTITAYISEHHGDCTPFISPVDVQLSAEDKKTIVQPDVLVVCDPSKIHTERIIGAPDFILEIISPSTRAKDYYRKAFKYQAGGVREYWIIDPIDRRLTVYYFEKEKPILVSPLEGKVGIGIYNDDLMIDLGEIGTLCEQ